MARKAKDDPLLDTFPPTQSEFDIEDFLEEWAPVSAVVEIYRMMKDGSRPHVERVGMEILREDLYGYIREHFGAGKYLLTFKDSSRKVRKNLVVDVDSGKPVVPGSPAPASYTPNDLNSQLMLALIQSIRPQPAPDMGTLLTGLGSMLVAMKPTPTGDPAAMLTAMAATFQQLKPEQDSVEKALKVISLAKDIGGGGEAREENFYTLLKDVSKTVADKLLPAGGGNGQGRPAIAPGGVPVVPMISQTVSDNPKNPQTSPAEESPDMLLEKWLRAQLQFLKGKARAGKDPEDWADYIFENEEEPGCAAMLEALKRGAKFEHLLQFDPEIGQNPILKSWFGTFYEALSAEFNADMDTSGTGRDPADLGGNEKPSTEGRPKP